MSPPRRQGSADGPVSEKLSAGRNGSAHEQVSEIQRARILAAMIEESARRGVANVTVAHVVERSGVSRRTFYELFADREDCFLAAFDDAVARARRYVLDVYDPKAGWAERVRTVVTGLLAFLTYERGAGQLLIVGSLWAGTRTLERRRRVLVQIIALVDEGRKETRSGAELPSLTAEGIVGGVLSVLHSRLLPGPPPLATGAETKAGPAPVVGDSRPGIPPSPEGDSPLALTGPLMSMIVLPYLGLAAARRELARPVPSCAPHSKTGGTTNALMKPGTRLTYRTVRVLMAVAADPGASNRAVGESAGISDQGQASKLLARLEKLGLIHNNGLAPGKGAPNAWTLTEKGLAFEQAANTQR
jgi:AcrR family transcriptional regulator